MRPLRLRSILWFDCTAAAIAGVALLALAGVVSPWLGVPRAVLLLNGVVNLAYGAFSFSLARRPSPPRRWVQALVIGNVAWVAVCVVMAVRFARPGSFLGAGYLLAEGVFVGVLAAVEGVAAFRNDDRAALKTKTAESP